MRQTSFACLNVCAMALASTIGCGQSPRPEPNVVAADSRVELAFVDELGGSFVLVKVAATIDGQAVAPPTTESAMSADDPLRFAGQTVPSGEHKARVNAVYRGEGHGVFSYLKGYKFKVSSTHEFRAPPHRGIRLVATCYEKGGPTTPLEDRPQIRWHEERE